MASPQKRAKTWQTDDTWRSVGYTYYRDSRQFRRVLDLNQSFDIRYHPAPGVEIFTTYSSGNGGKIEQANASSTPGLLQQTDVVLDLRRPAADATSSEIAAAIFPWDSTVAYVNRLGEYTAAALFDRDRTNGYGLDSPQAQGNR